MESRRFFFVAQVVTNTLHLKRPWWSAGWRWIPLELRSVSTRQRSTITHRIHGTGMSTYIYNKHQLFMSRWIYQSHGSYGLITSIANLSGFMGCTLRGHYVSLCVCVCVCFCFRCPHEDARSKRIQYVAICIPSIGNGNVSDLRVLCWFHLERLNGALHDYMKLPKI